MDIEHTLQVNLKCQILIRTNGELPNILELAREVQIMLDHYMELVGDKVHPCVISIRMEV